MYEWREHTAEVELAIDAVSEAAVFEEAAVALGELVRMDEGEPARRIVSVTAHDRGARLVDWLEELIFLADTQGFAASGGWVRLEDDGVHGELEGTLGSIDPLVKAATYHGLSFEELDGRWYARVVLDV